MNFDLVISGGRLVSAKGQRRLDIGIRGEKIACLGKGLKSSGSRIIDARGKYIFPGVIDPHVHFGLEAYRARTGDDFVSGTEAAACGGVTSIIDYAIPGNGESTLSAVRRRKSEAAGRAVVDYSFHAQIVSWDEKTRKEIGQLIRSGIPSFKIFMPATEGWMVDDAGLFGALGALGRRGGIVEVHAENGPLINAFIKKLASEGKLAVKYFPLSRPNLVEEEAVRRAITLDRAARGRLCVVHLTTREGLEAIREAKRKGIEVYVETAPQYLLLDKRCFGKKNGYKYLACPPIKSAEDNKALWEGLQDGSIDWIGTDHCSFAAAKKHRARNDFRKGPYGLPGVETSLSLLFTEGCRKRGLRMERLVELTSTNAAKILGLYPRKGTVRAGSDADLVVFDPEKKVTIDYKKLSTRCDWSPYQGFKLTGFPHLTISRGQVVARDGRFVGAPGRGRFLKRKTGKAV